MTESKEFRVIRAKIATKEERIDEISMIGPIALAGIGILIFTISAIPSEEYGSLWGHALFGLIICGIAVWWLKSLEDKIAILKCKINELEAELEE